MAEDEGSKTGPDPTDAHKPGPVEPLSATPGQTETTSTGPTVHAGPKSEWTASDERGPLIEAHGEPGHLENFGSAEPTDTPEQIHAEQADVDHVHAPAAEAASSLDSRPAPSTATPEPTKRSAWPIAAGLIAGAVIGSLVAIFVYRSQVEDGGADPQVAALSAKVAALEAKPGSDAAMEPLKSAVADLQTKVAALQKAVAGRPTAAGATPTATSPNASTEASGTAPAKSAQPAFDPAPLDKKIAALSASVAALATQTARTQDLGGTVGGLDSKLGGLASTVADLQKQAATNGSSLRDVEAQQKSLAGKVGTPALAVVSDSLVQAIEAGQPYAMQVDALGSLGADPVKLAVLKQNAQSGVPSGKTLAAKFAPLAEPILATEHKAPPNASFMERLKSGMFSLVSVRRADDVGGSDLASHVARIQSDLAHDDLADAVATWSALPADAKAKSDAWGALAKTSAETLSAAQGLQSDAIAALGGKKS